MSGGRLWVHHPEVVPGGPRHSTWPPTSMRDPAASCIPRAFCWLHMHIVLLLAHCTLFCCLHFAPCSVACTCCLHLVLLIAPCTLFCSFAPCLLARCLCTCYLVHLHNPACILIAALFSCLSRAPTAYAQGRVPRTMASGVFAGLPAFYPVAGTRKTHMRKHGTAIKI